MPAPFDPPLEAAELLSELRDLYSGADKIFTGGQAVVFRAATVSGGDHALKVYFPDPDAHVDERTDREVSALRRLRCDSLVTLEADGHVILRGSSCRFVATSFIEGESVASALKNGPMTVSLAARIGVDVARALGVLWTERIVHRDVTPNNLMLAKGGRTVLIDLGLARHTALASLSAPNQGWGTMGYLSPEQSAGVRALTCKSDIFSLGIVLQQCLIGKHPCGRDQRRLTLGGLPTASLSTTVPKELCQIVDAMVRQAAPRRPSPANVVKALQPFEEDGHTVS